MRLNNILLVGSFPKHPSSAALHLFVKSSIIAIKEAQ